MSTTHSPATWQDLADELTPEQVAELQHWETLDTQSPQGEVMRTWIERARERQLYAAQRMIRENHANAALAHIEVPADALGVPTGWSEYDDEVWQRTYKVYQRTAAGIMVEVLGYQYADGRPTERFIFWENTDQGEELSAARAKILAHFLTEAAELVDKLAAPA